MLKVKMEIDPIDLAYIKSMPKKFTESITKSILHIMIFAEQQAKDIFEPGTEYDSFTEGMMETNANPPPGPLKERTGRLKASIRARAYKSKGVLGTKVAYGIIHEEYGIKGDKAQTRPFLMPSFENKFGRNNWDKVREELITGVVVGLTE